MRSLGVIGCGVVGSAVAQGFINKKCKVYRYDKFKSEFNELSEVMSSDIIFLCVPTPTSKDTGVQDLSALEETFDLLNSHKFGGIVVIKSTVLPGTSERLALEYGLPRVVHNPEFLTAARPLEDFMNQPAVLVGGKDLNAVVEVGELYFNCGFKKVRIFSSAKITEAAKYMHNLFLSVKVSFCNEMYDVCQHLGINYEEVRIGTVEMGGIGEGHTLVPGPDGKRGFGGMCFPKDTQAFLKFAEDSKLDMPVLDSAVRSNFWLRPEGD